MAPPTVEQAEEWLAMLQVATARRAGSDVFDTVALAVYSGALVRYPADVARAACWDLARGKGAVAWWPTLSELLGVCDRLVSTRLCMLAALERAEERAGFGLSGVVPVPRKMPTAEERNAQAGEARAWAAGVRAAAKERRVSFPASHGELAPGSALTPQMHALLRRQRGLPPEEAEGEPYVPPWVEERDRMAAEDRAAAAAYEAEQGAAAR